MNHQLSRAELNAHCEHLQSKTTEHVRQIISDSNHNNDQSHISKSLHEKIQNLTSILNEFKNNHLFFDLNLPHVTNNSKENFEKGNHEKISKSDCSKNKKNKIKKSVCNKKKNTKIKVTKIDAHMNELIIALLNIRSIKNKISELETLIDELNV